MGAKGATERECLKEENFFPIERGEGGLLGEGVCGLKTVLLTIFLESRNDCYDNYRHTFSLPFYTKNTKSLSCQKNSFDTIFLDDG